MIEFKLGKLKHSGEIKIIDEVPRGKLCDCVCPDCGLDFVAAKGMKNEWHFRHQDRTDCKGGQETALHLLAKEIITANIQIKLPTYGRISYSNAVSEQYFQSIKPDVSAIINGKNLFFEILVTNPIGDFKEQFYKNGEFKSIEIDLRNFEFTSRQNLEDFILNDITCKRIIFWQKEKVIEKSCNDNLIIITLLAIVGIVIFIFNITRLKQNYRNVLHYM